MQTVCERDIDVDPEVFAIVQREDLAGETDQEAGQGVVLNHNAPAPEAGALLPCPDVEGRSYLQDGR